MKIIIDAMGGDNAPKAAVDGAIAALRDFSDIEIVLTGDEQAVKPLLGGQGYDAGRLTVVHTAEVIEMNDAPVKAIKEKKDSSMVRAMDLLSKDPRAMMISAGNTGALVAGSTLLVKRIPGIKRPALASVLPAAKGEVLLIDGGANVDCRPAYLQQFGIMGSIFMSKVFGLEKPRVGLINNGGEEEKGSELTKEAYQLLKAAPINFAGNAEGRDLLSGGFDVVVCDGFTGNILLKFLEGCAKTILGMLKGYIVESAQAKLGAVMMKGAFTKLKKKMDYTEYGAALLLGLRGGVMKAHGSSNGRAFYSSIREARKFISGDVVSVIKEEIGKLNQATAD
ncbi:MAG TPA: phosphate acyltransferase PlsX [Clostridiales bacterium]|nr:phosphate acyltransferase PlsX [Clostridiales bacterium]